MNIKEINPLAEVVKQLEKELEEEIDLRKGAESVIKRHIKTIERSRAYYNKLEVENKELREQRDELREVLSRIKTYFISDIDGGTLDKFDPSLARFYHGTLMDIQDYIEDVEARIKDGE